jgi:hypothetical protein
MRLHIKNYRWDVRRGHFVPLSMEPLEEEERATPELVEGIVEALEDIYEKLGNKSAARRAAGAVESASEAAADLVMPERTKRVFEQFRRHVPRRKPQTIEISSARIAAAVASLANNPPATGGEATAATKPENRADLSTATGKP